MSRELVTTSWLTALLLFVSACSTSASQDPTKAPPESVAQEGADATADAPSKDSGAHDAMDDGRATQDKAATCASDFGNALTSTFGRLDGTVVAIVQPKDTQCPLFNDDHVVLQVRSGGGVYRMVINIVSSFGSDLRVRYQKLAKGLLGGGWSEGWHPNAHLDYVGDLGLHSNAAGFQPFTMANLSARIAEDIDVGDHVSVFAHSTGGSSAHKIHRNGSGVDGAIVIHADRPEPQYLLFHFDTQSF